MTANTTTLHFIGDAFLQGTRDDQSGDSSVSGIDAVSLLLSHSVTTVLLLKDSALKINFKFSCRMFWRVSYEIVAKSQNRWIIEGSNPSTSFQVWKRGCHVVRFLCSLSMSLSLFVKDTTFIKCCGSHESGRAFLFSMTRKTDMTSMWRLFT